MTRTLFTALVLGLIAGCHPSGPMPPDGVRRDPVATEAYPQISALGDLGPYLVYDTPILAGGAHEGSPMRVTVPVRLRTSSKGSRVQYQFEFFDASGRRLEPAMDWRYLAMPSKAQVFMEGSSLDNNAVDWRLTIKPAK